MYRDLIKKTQVTICSVLSKVNKVMHLVFLMYTNGNKYSETAQTPDPKLCEPSHHLIYYQFDNMQRKRLTEFGKPLSVLYLRQTIDLIICQYHECIFDGKCSFTYLKDVHFRPVHS